MGPPSLICFLNNGTTDPCEPKTLPNLTVINLVLEFENLSLDWIIDSANFFVAPIALDGLTALSVDINTKHLALYFSDKLASMWVAKTLVLIASDIFSSQIATCFNAAA